MKAKCPNGCSTKAFITGVIEYHDWKVDEHGNFLEDLGSEQSEKPRSDAVWTCTACGAEAEVE